MPICRLVLVALLVTTGAVSRIHAACTTIPDRALFLRGARGSIDRPFLSPDPDEVVTLTSNAALDGDNSPAWPMASTDVLITAIFKPPGGATPTTFFIAGNDDCESLEEPACFLERLFCHPARSCTTGTAVGLSIGMQNNLQQLRFHFPETHAAGSVILAVTSASQPPPLELQSETCAEFQKSGRRSDLAVCIDSFNLTDIDPPGVDPAATHLVALPASNDYRAECTHDVGDQPTCTGKAADIIYTVDAEGNVLIPMKWHNILRQLADGKLAQRELRASTSAEAVLGQGKRVFIPSAVFLETMNHQGGSFSPSPLFVPQELPDRPNEQTVVGTADKGKSVLKIKRRKQWDHTCNGGSNQAQACEPATAIEDCPGAQCASSPPGYFACVGAERNTQPCTRSQHCPNGTCERISDSGSLCFAYDGQPTGAPPCKQDNDCGPNADCGAGLFEYRNRLTNGVGKLHRTATSSVPGVCDRGSHVGQMCTGALTCNGFIFGPAACVTYRADALTYSSP